MVEGQVILREAPFPWLGFVFWVGLFAWFGIKAWTRFLAERERQQTLRSYAERGNPPDRELMEKLFPPASMTPPPPWQPTAETTRRGLVIGGIVTGFAGLGLLGGAQLVGLMDYDALIGMSTAGVIALCVGLGLLTSAWALRRMQSRGAQDPGASDGGR
jgi:hypothetical protein